MQHNLITHRDAWREAIVAAIANSDYAEADYWRHELKAYDDTQVFLKPHTDVLMADRWPANGES